MNGLVRYEVGASGVQAVRDAQRVSSAAGEPIELVDHQRALLGRDQRQRLLQRRSIVGYLIR
ncbi:MAG: hypothetical protein V3T48_08680 [Vicinamibacterales bacterium]